MRTLQVSKSNARIFLAKKLAASIVKSDIDDLVLVLRYNCIGGFEQLDDFDLFENLVAAIPDLEQVFLADNDEHSLHLAVKPDHSDREEAVLANIRNTIGPIL